MARRKKKDLETVADKLEELADELDEMGDSPVTHSGIVIEVTIIEALLAEHSNSNRVAIASIVQQIRERAQDQYPEKFPR